VLDFESNATQGNDLSAAMYVEEGCIAWDPHASKQCAVGLGNGLKLVDTREMEVTAHHATAHDETVRCVCTRFYFSYSAFGLAVYRFPNRQLMYHEDIVDLPLPLC
jgi:hypothetical protein